MPGVDFDKLRADISIQQVLHLLGFEPNRCRGNQWYGFCPLPGCQSSSTSSFSVNVATGRFYCHRCHSHGHQIELWSAATALPLHPAAIDLCTRLNHEVPWIRRW